MFFNKRYPKNTWDNSLSNKYFQYSAKKYGRQNFNLVFLKIELNTPEELDYWEQFYIKKYDSLYPGGYNFNQGGRHFTEEQKQKIGKANSKTYSLKNTKTNEIITINNMNEFCRVNNLRPSSILHVVHNRAKKHKNWIKPETILDSIKKYFVLSPKNEIFSIKSENVKHFCEEHQLHNTCFSRVLKGERISHKGWILTSSKIEYIEVFNSGNQCFKIDKLARNIKQFCSEHQLNYESFCCLLRGETKSSQGWRIDKNNKLKYYIVESHDKIKYEIRPYTIKLFCKNHSINYNTFSSFLSNRRKKCKNWTFIETLYK